MKKRKVSQSVELYVTKGLALCGQNFTRLNNIHKIFIIVFATLSK